MNISTHSVSDYEQELQQNEWRIVILMRNMKKQNVQQAQELFFGFKNQ